MSGRHQSVGTHNLFSLGLKDRDRVNDEFGGGIPSGSIVIMEGEFGAGKSVFTQRFTYGLCEEGYQTTYLSTELTVGGMLDQMDSLNYDVISHLLKNRLLFLEGDIDTGGVISESGAITDDPSRMDLLSRMMDAEVMWEADVILIDTFSAILRNDPNFESLVRNDEGRQGALEIINYFREIISEGKSIVLTVDPTTVADSVISPFRSIADVFFELETVQVGNDTNRQVNVRRFAGMGEQVGDTIGFSVREGVGVVIENRSIA